MLANFTRNLARKSGSRPEIGAGSDATLSHLDTMDIYAQIVPVAQRRAVEKLSEFVSESVRKSVPKPVPLLVQ